MQGEGPWALQPCATDLTRQYDSAWRKSGQTGHDERGSVDGRHGSTNEHDLRPASSGIMASWHLEPYLLHWMAYSSSEY